MAIFKNLFRWQRGRQASGYDKNAVMWRLLANKI